MAQRPKADRFQLEVPLDASRVEGLEAEQTVKVVAQARDGSSTSATVKLGKSGKASAVVRFSKQPGSLRVAIGPANATDEELLGTQTNQCRGIGPSMAGAAEANLGARADQLLLLVLVAAVVSRLHDPRPRPVSGRQPGSRRQGLRFGRGLLVVVV